MRLLVVSPDYASHYLPLAAVAGAAVERGIDVVVATGPTMRDRVVADGFGWVELRTAAGSNAGLRRADQRDDDLRPFIDATRRGMLAVLSHQADARRHDLLHEPARVARDTRRVLDAVTPDVVLVDHLSVVPRLVLDECGCRLVTFVPGHPSQLPRLGERYGYPVAWPDWAAPDLDGLAALWARCGEVTDDLVRQVVPVLAPSAGELTDVFAPGGATVVHNSPAATADPDRGPSPPRHHLLGSCVREPARLDDEAQRWLDAGGPFTYVSLGTFLSGRTDVLRRVAASLISAGRRAAVAVGPDGPDALGAVPADWLVRPSLPQVELIASAEVVVCHGGNNTVTEALTAGRPVLALPLSTDQFCIAADLERSGLGASADPNRCRPDELGVTLGRLDDPALRQRVAAVGSDLRDRPGARRAVDVLVDDR